MNAMKYRTVKDSMDESDNLTDLCYYVCSLTEKVVRNALYGSV